MPKASTVWRKGFDGLGGYAGKPCAGLPSGDMHNLDPTRMLVQHCSSLPHAKHVCGILVRIRFRIAALLRYAQSEKDGAQTLFAICAFERSVP